MELGPISEKTFDDLGKARPARKPFFSVIIPVYNRTDLLKRAVASVLRQDFADFELLVVDDGSIDDIRGIVDGFSDSRIRYFRQANRGASAARNAGIDLARGDNVAFLDSERLSFTPNESLASRPVGVEIVGVRHVTEIAPQQLVLREAEKLAERGWSS